VKGKLAMYWAASCGGCEISLLTINEKILDVDAAFDLVFCPCIADGKTSDIEKMADGEIDLCLWNGGIRNSEQEYMARLLRQKSKALVAYGACASAGGIPGLANLCSKESILRTVYDDNPSLDNPGKVRPQPECEVEGCHLTIPVMYESVRSLDQVVHVDYFLPGCPPEESQIWATIVAVLENKLPPNGSTIGPITTVCDECKRVRTEKKVKRFFRTWQIIPTENDCLNEQGLICAGLATRAGCGARCPQVNSPCIGCYGPNEGCEDHGARLMSALASVIDSNDPVEIDRIIADGVPDPVGTFYRFSLPTSLMRMGERK
jgi:F420-non-reducing hydrogenase small subunit